ncbi:MAG: hypothetical protein A3B38_00850 [Candidatus Levybacteria bacterium RIFCSPLOWO2_01_FULL_36_13]|nr:MAG: hypothetical protein A2684_02090 [Candidatus Levybacteria bacterium RIFCSPHIGHO2_01_FULL_36_15b]OGH35437.1 MAG: hypothetical protein A3B38_00850 [Candidatus Levybacteria bacterium RIFCSPLOWO2_01_FULL_36_13]
MSLHEGESLIDQAAARARSAEEVKELQSKLHHAYFEFANECVPSKKDLMKRHGWSKELIGDVLDAVVKSTDGKDVKVTLTFNETGMLMQVDRVKIDVDNIPEIFVTSSFGTGKAESRGRLSPSNPRIGGVYQSTPGNVRDLEMKDITLLTGLLEQLKDSSTQIIFRQTTPH